MIFVLAIDELTLNIVHSNYGKTDPTVVFLSQCSLLNRRAHNRRFAHGKHRLD